MKRSFLPQHVPLTLLSALPVLAIVGIWFTPNWQASSNPAKPGMTEPGPMPRLAEPTPLFTEIEPAKNPIRLCLQDDGRKVLGWVSGTEELKGRPVYVTVDGNKAKRETVHIDKDNTFTWEYKLDKPTKVEFLVDNCYLPLPWIADSITVAPAVAEKE